MNKRLEPYSAWNPDWQESEPKDLLHADKVVLIPYTLWKKHDDGHGGRSGQGTSGVAAINPKTGKILWSNLWAPPLGLLPEVVNFKNRYVRFSNGRLWASDAISGKTLWTKPCEGCSAVSCNSDAAQTNRIIAVKKGVVSIEVGRIHVNSWKGKELWSTTVIPTTPFSAITVGNGVVYAISDSKSLCIQLIMVGNYGAEVCRWYVSSLAVPNGVFVALKGRRSYT